MSEKLKTFIVTTVSKDFIINTEKGIYRAIKHKTNNEYKMAIKDSTGDNGHILLNKSQLVKFFNLDLEVEDEN